MKLLDEMHEQLRQAVRRLSARKVSSTPPGTKVSNSRSFTGIAAHDLYHAGQIQLLKRLINQTAHSAFARNAPPAATAVAVAKAV